MPPTSLFLERILVDGKCVRWVNTQPYCILLGNVVIPVDTVYKNRDNKLLHAHDVDVNVTNSGFGRIIKYRF
jgi:hypothetical protein